MDALINGLLSLGILVVTAVVLSKIMKKMTQDPAGEEGDREEQSEYGNFSFTWSINDKKK